LASNLDLFLEHDDLIEMLLRVIKLISAESEFSSLVLCIVDEQLAAKFLVLDTLCSQTGKYLVTMAAQAIFWRSLTLFEAQDSDNSSISTEDVIEARDSVIECLIAVASSKLDIDIRLQVLYPCCDMQGLSNSPIICLIHRIVADVHALGRSCNI
jgi:hypothetical protein